MRSRSAPLIALALAVVAAGTPAAMAQRISSRVTTEDGRPLPGATVAIASVQQGAITDLDGRYLIAGLPDDTLTLAFSFVGFERTERKVDLRRGDATVDVTLRVAVETLEEVTVTEERLGAALTRAAQSVAVLDAADLAERRGQTLGETLDHLPGVTTLSTGPSISKPVIRGLHSDRIVVLNSGIRQEGQQWGAEHAPEIDPFAPDRIEVIKGASSVEYGVGAIGGVIRVEPRELPRMPGVGGEVLLNGFSNNRQVAGSLLMEGGLKTWRGIGWRVQGSFRRAGDARTPDYVLGNTGFAEASGSGAVGYHTDRLGIDAIYSRFSTTLGIFYGAHIGNKKDLLDAIARGRPLRDFDFTYDIDKPKQAITHDLITVLGHYRLPAGDLVEVQYGFQNNHRQEYDAHNAYNDSLAALKLPAFDLTLRTNTLDARFEHRPFGKLIGAVGISGMNQGNVNGRSGYLIPNFRALTGGVFAHESWVGEQWTFEAGTRFDYRWMRAYPFDRPSRTFNTRYHTFAGFSGIVGTIWQFSPTWSLSVNASSAWRPPGINELYSFGVHHGAAQVETGDPNLHGERSLDLSTTLRQESKIVSLETSFYANRIFDYMYLLPNPEPTVTIRGTFPSFEYTQNDARLVGLDGSISLRPWHRLELSAAASLLRADNVDTNEPLFGIPSNRFRLGSRLLLPQIGSIEDPFVEIETQFVGRQDRVAAGVQDYAPPPPGYTLVNLKLGSEIEIAGHMAHLNAGIQNLFNVAYRDYLSRYRYFADDTGRTVTLRLSIPFGRFQP